MKRLQPILMVFALLLLSSTEGSAADFQTGYKAYRAKDYVTAFNELKPLAEAGHECAQYYLAATYMKTKDRKEAFKWLKRSAEAGFVLPMLDLGHYYARGLGGVKRNYELAYKWWFAGHYIGHPITYNQIYVPLNRGSSSIIDLVERWRYDELVKEVQEFIKIIDAKYGFIVISEPVSPAKSGVIVFLTPNAQDNQFCIMQEYWFKPLERDKPISNR